ncbi:MAG: carbohydrate binding domain-containing protein, partial [Endomicrobia bacterium]|nr:carbohydrate binding domain-containing protein [Endomicrobiia bacterium]
MKKFLKSFCFFIFWIIPLFSQTFYFYLPCDDSSNTVVDVSWLNHKPAGKYGFVSVGQDGHFYVGQERIKFLGVNFTSDACFPLKTQAEQVAKRLAKFGVNIARLHFLDNPWGYSIFGYAGTYTNTRSFNQEALDRLDYFIAKLKENGIYVNINLVVGRNFMPGDGLPNSINQLDWKQKQVPAMFYQSMIDLQKEYADNLLTRLNPYTSTYYNNEPAIAMVEIINEHGLIQGWLDGTIDILPSEFSNDLRQKWNNWLTNKYQTHSNLISSGWALSEPLGQEMLRNADFSQGFTYWNREQHDVARASFTIVNEGPNNERAVKITIQNTSPTSWHVQFNQPNLVVSSTRPYTLSFYAKADRNISIRVQIGQAHEPWYILGFDRTINLTTYYQLFNFELTVSTDDNNARVNFTDMCKELATYWFSNISFKPGGNVGLLPGENLDNKTINIIKYQERNIRTQRAQRDWVEFLYQLEENFWLEMYNYLKNTVGIKGVITGTTVGLTSVPNIMSKLDFVDTHSYWHHPVFPGTSWDPNNWYVTNATLVKDLNGGTISEIATRRVYGKPFTITEY